MLKFIGLFVKFLQEREEIYMLSQEILRDRLLQIVKCEGITQKHISKQTKIRECDLSKFKNNKGELGSLSEKALNSYLLSKGY